MNSEFFLKGFEEADDDPREEALAEEAAFLMCPYCGAEVELLLDPGGGAVQSYVEDCEVCCQPWQLRVTWDDEGRAHVDASTEDDIA